MVFFIHVHIEKHLTNPKTYSQVVLKVRESESKVQITQVEDGSKTSLPF